MRCSICKKGFSKFELVNWGYDSYLCKKCSKVAEESWLMFNASRDFSQPMQVIIGNKDGFPERELQDCLMVLNVISQCEIFNSWMYDKYDPVDVASVALNHESIHYVLCFIVGNLASVQYDNVVSKLKEDEYTFT